MPLSLSTLPSILLLLFHGTFTYPSTQASYSREDFQYLAGWVRSLHCAFSATSCALPNYTTHSAILYLFIYLGLVPDHELTQGRECTSTFISLPPSPMPNSNGSQWEFLKWIKKNWINKWILRGCHPVLETDTHIWLVDYMYNDTVQENFLQ